MASRMKDVAERAGVSVTTVSHLLNGTRPVAPETEARILSAIDDLEYHKNVHARRLSMNQSDLLGLLISEIANPFFAELINGFQSAAWANGFDVLLFNTEYEPERSASAVGKMMESGVRGVAVMTSHLGEDFVDTLHRNQIGVVVYNLGKPAKLTSNIQINYSEGIAEAIDHLRELGHKRIGVIAGPRSNRTAVRIQTLITEELDRSGIKQIPVRESDYKVDGGVAAVQSILAEKERPTALICGNDLIAMGAMSALEDAGVRVPDDVSVIGFDDIFFSRLARPPLTTIRLPRKELGELAFQALHRMLRSKRRRGAEYAIETSLVVRRSTAKPPKGSRR